VSANSVLAETEPRRDMTGSRHPQAVRALVRRDWRITRSYRTALVTDLGFGFLNLVAYYYISRTLKVGLRSGLNGAPDYFAFAAVGVALSVVLQAAITGVSRRLREEQLTGTLEALCVQPISSAELAFGLAGFPFLFAVVRAFAYLLLAAAFLGLSLARTDWLGLLVSFLVSGLALAALGVGLAAIVLVFKRADAIGALGTFGLSLLGGAFFPSRVLPHWLRPIADVLPTHYAFNAVRSALFGTGDWLGPVAALAAVGAVTMVVALAMFSAAVRHAIRQGTLNQY
jgi:ABC-2 type transport system permease protein